jgi:hypothetical protein
VAHPLSHPKMRVPHPFRSLIAERVGDLEPRPPVLGPSYKLWSGRQPDEVTMNRIETEFPHSFGSSQKCGSIGNSPNMSLSLSAAWLTGDSLPNGRNWHGGWPMSEENKTGAGGPLITVSGAVPRSSRLYRDERAGGPCLAPGLDSETWETSNPLCR